jgi:hypothetical protein
MSHNAKLVEQRVENNAAISIRFRCCGDERSDAWGQLQGLHRDPAELKADIEQMRASVEEKHEHLLRAHDFVGGLLEE